MDIAEDKVKETLETIRPYLQVDGGDVEFVKINQSGIVEVKLIGACSGCPMSQMTLRAGIERALMREIPEIKRVEAIND
jgi:Fe-S cluster biogenesis protein NfuA